MAEQLRRELADIIRDEIKDPRLGLMSFTEVRMSKDLSHAVVYVSFLDADHQADSIAILNSAAGFIRKQVARRIRARIVPTLKFVIDDSVSRGAAMDELIHAAIQSDMDHAHGDEDAQSDTVQDDLQAQDPEQKTP
jgi:ribosome-binding factor A